MRREDSNFEESLEKTAGRRLVGGSDRGTDRHLTENPGRGADRHSERRLERNPGRRLARSLDKGEDRHLAERPERSPGGYRTENPGRSPEKHSQLRETIRRQIVEELELRRQVEDDELGQLIDERIMEAGRGIYLTLRERMKMKTELFNSFRRLDLLQALVDDREITEIMVNGPDAVFVERRGRIERWESSFESAEQLEDLIQQIVSRINRVVNMRSPIADARLEDGSRVHVVLRPVALDGPILTIRKFPEPITMERLVELKSISGEAAGFMRTLVASGYNIFVSGGTGSGKTTFLNALSEFIPAEERIITIEDSAELQIRHVPNLVRLETRNASVDGAGEISMGDLIRASLRMNPSRILVGEVRGKEALEMLQAMNTGHDGSLSTGHGNSPADMLSRLETMVLGAAELPLPAIRSQIASALDIMVHVGRLRDRSRKVLCIMEVDGCEDGKISLHPVFQFRETGTGAGGQVEGILEKVGELENRDKLRAAGYTL